MLCFLLDWKSVKKTSRPHYGSPLKNEINLLATHHRHKTYLLCRQRFSGYIQIQGFCFFSVNDTSPWSCLENIVITISLTNAITIV